MNTQSKGFTFGAALLSLSLLTIMAGAGVAPGLYKVAEAFPDSPETVIKLIVSLPSLVMIAATLLCGQFLRFMTPRALIMSGLVLYVIGGVGAGFMNSMPLILVCRGILGLGTGIILPFSTGLVAVCYQGAQKIRMMGLSSAANAFGAITSNLIAGYLATANWRYTFHVYWIGLLALILVSLFLRNLPERKAPEQGLRLPKTVYIYGAICLCLMMVLFLIITNLPFIVEDKGIGSSQLTGYLFSINSLFILLGGLTLSKTLQLGRYFLPTSLWLFAAGILAIALANNTFWMVLAAAVSGFSFGALYPYFLSGMTQKTPQSLTVKAMAVGMAFAWFGQFLSPLLFGAIGAVFGLEKDELFCLIFAVIVLIAIGHLVLSLTRKLGFKEE